jgi:hypothetical protein
VAVDSCIVSRILLVWAVLADIAHLTVDSILQTEGGNARAYSEKTRNFPDKFL